ncbi:hypothetical protein LMG27174_02805 [Paraburkholderia rhynchosiae]|uniref:Uncharacterized protein n=1 Tax=Paraburkholderia rhynchosiae TaxID=487049 RepID=A0A6J5AZ42_9BURK|nr:hypothetical protein LMG27174_02805 [Paraburkholderia rhynchosiae]
MQPASAARADRGHGFNATEAMQSQTRHTRRAIRRWVQLTGAGQRVIFTPEAWLAPRHRSALRTLRCEARCITTR